MNTVIEMHDSYLLALDQNDPEAHTLLFDAVVHRSEGELGHSAGDEGMQRIRIKMKDLTLDGFLGELPGDIYEGSLTVNDGLQDNVVPFPAAYSGAAQLRFMFRDGREFTLAGRDLTIEADGEFRGFSPQ